MIATGPHEGRARLAELFGWRAEIPFEIGLRRTVDWYLANREAAEARDH